MSPSSGPITREEVLQVLPRSAATPSPGDQTHLPLDEVERLHIERVLESSGGNKTKAAQTLRIDYKTLSAKLKKYESGG
ncbi:MAG: helix-turn-helix domain-containing protein [Nitrospira sp.]|nr:helix-turn-helix domain-containing protein [Nitrospira sp.]